MPVFEKDTYVFLPDDDHCFVAAKVTSSFEKGKPGAVLLVAEDRLVRITAKQSANTQVMDPQSLRRWPDMVLLKQLDDASLLHNLRLRYEKDEIFTNIGTILISVNPYKYLPELFGPAIMDDFIGSGSNVSEMQPHIYGVAEDAFYQLTTYNNDQSCIITGESGAGKTEATKLFLQYIAERSRRNRSDGPSGMSTDQGGPSGGREYTVPLREQILGVNPLMEAFGNAKTVRNDNSSRFGKLIDVIFDRNTNTVVGGEITNYLLEKSRVVRHLEGERSYHVFYQLCAAAAEDADMKKNLRLDEATQYYYLNQSTKDSTQIENVEDAIEWEATVSSMRLLRLDQKDQDAVNRVLAGILHLGNIEFEPQGNTDFAGIINKGPLQDAADMLGVDADALSHGLLNRDISNKAERVIQKHNVREATESRDALAKHTYSRLFNWLTHRVNLALRKADGKQTRKIAVLDIFGFESFGHNSFEQLCINYCNEKLQGFFNNHIFKLEQALYAAEEIDVSQIGFSDNQGVIDTIDHKSNGIFAICDDEVNLLRGTDDGFLAKVLQTAKQMAAKAGASSNGSSSGPAPARKKSFTPQMLRRATGNNMTTTSLLGTGRPLDTKVFLKEPGVKVMRNNEGARNAFIIVHFAGEVMYNVTGFLEKNRDVLRTDLLDVVAGSSIELVSELFAAENENEVREVKRQKNGGNRKTLGRKFQEQLDTLMVRLSATEPHFVRTIKPNALKKPSVFEEPLVLDQLRYAGLLEVCRIRQMGYPVRKDHADFFQMFCCIHPEAKDLDDLLDKLVADGLLKGAEWQKGKSKVFMRAAQFDELSKAREEALWDVTVLLQRQTRRFLARSKYVRTKTAFEDLERGIRERNRRLLETAIPFAAGLPNAGKHTTLLDRARRILGEIKEEEKHLEMLRTAVDAKDVGALPSLIATAETMGLGSHDVVKEAKAIVKRSTEEKDAIEALRSAIESRDIRSLESALENAEGLGLAGSTEARTARALLDRLQEQAALIEKLEDAMRRKDIDAMSELVQALVDLGAGDHPSVVKAQRITKKIIQESEARKKALEDLDEELRAAMDARDLDALNALRIRIEELGAKGEVVEAAMELRRRLEMRQGLLDRLKVEVGVLATKSRSLDGIVESDLEPLQDALTEAEENELTPLNEPEVRSAADFLARMTKQLEVQDMLEEALEENTYSALLRALLAAQALSMVTANAQRVAEEVRALEKIKMALSRIDERKMREKRMSLLRYATASEQEDLERERLDKMDSKEFHAKLEDAEHTSLYELTNYYRIRDDDDYTESFPYDEREQQAALKLWSQRSPIPKSLHEVDEDQNIIAVRCNRAVLQYCGDALSTNTAGLAQFIVVSGLCDPRVGDEIYIQLCKHLRGNNSKASEDRAWLLMCACTKYFPPTEMFEKYLLYFLLEHRTRPSLVGNYARLCLAQLGPTIEMGPCKYKPSLEELGHYLKRPPVLASIQIIDGSVVTLPVSPDMRLDVVTKLVRQSTGILDAVKRQAWSIFVKDGAETNNDGLRDRLVRFYKFWNPAKLKHVEVYVSHWQGRDDELFEKLVEQYGAEPVYDNNAKRNLAPNGAKPAGLLLPITVARAAGKLLRSKDAKRTTGPAPRIAWSLPNWTFLGDVFSRMAKQHREPTFVFKRRFLPTKGKADLHLFQQLQHDVENGSIVITSDHDIAELAAISLALEAGEDLDLEDENDLVKRGLSRHIPRASLDEKPVQVWAKTIANMVDLGSDGDSALRQRYCDICKRAPAYGKTLFNAIRADSNRQYIIAVDLVGIHVLTPSLDSIVRTFPHKAIKKYGAVAGTFWMKMSKSKLEKEGKSLGRRVSRRFGGAKPADLKQTTTGLAGSSTFDFIKRDNAFEVVLSTLTAWELFDSVWSAQMIIRDTQKA